MKNKHTCDLLLNAAIINYVIMLWCGCYKNISLGKIQMLASFQVYLVGNCYDVIQGKIDDILRLL